MRGCCRGFLEADKPAIELARFEDSAAPATFFSFHSGILGLVLGGQACNGFGKVSGDCGEILRRQPQTKGCAPIVVSREIVIEAKTFRSFADQTGRNSIGIGCESGLEQGEACILKKSPGQVEAFHVVSS